MQKQYFVSATVCNDVKNYVQFCTIFDLTQIIKCAAHITCSSTSLIDHILSIPPETTSHEGVINVGLSDHQLFYCTTKNIRIKIGGKRKKIKFC